MGRLLGMAETVAGHQHLLALHLAGILHYVDPFWRVGSYFSRRNPAEGAIRKPDKDADDFVHGFYRLDVGAGPGTGRNVMDEVTGCGFFIFPAYIVNVAQSPGVPLGASVTGPESREAVNGVMLGMEP